MIGSRNSCQVASSTASLLYRWVIIRGSVVVLMGAFAFHVGSLIHVDCLPSMWVVLLFKLSSFCVGGLDVAVLTEMLMRLRPLLFLILY